MLFPPFVLLFLKLRLFSGGVYKHVMSLKPKFLSKSANLWNSWKFSCVRCQNWSKYSYSLRFGGFHSDQSKASLWGGRRGLTESLSPGTPSWVRPTSALAHDSLWTPSACPWLLLGKCQAWAEPLQTQKGNRFISLQIRTSEENWLEIHS